MFCGAIWFICILLIFEWRRIYDLEFPKSKDLLPQYQLMLVRLDDLLHKCNSPTCNNRFKTISRNINVVWSRRSLLLKFIHNDQRAQFNSLKRNNFIGRLNVTCRYISEFWYQSTLTSSSIIQVTISLCYLLSKMNKSLLVLSVAFVAFATMV